MSKRVESPIERFCLGVLLRDPELLYRVDRKLQALSLERLSPQNFTGTEHQVIFQAVQEALTQEEEEPAHHWRNCIETPLLTLADSLLAEVIDFDFTQPRVIKEIMTNFLRLRKRNLELTLTHLRFQLLAVQEGESFEEGQDGDVWHHMRQVQHIASEKERLDRALAGHGGQNPTTLIAEGR